MIDTLVADILRLVDEGNLHEFATQHISLFADKLAMRVSNRLAEERRPAELRMSNLGMSCERQLWGRIRTPELLEALPATTKVKFLYGDILEELLIFLARESGHVVEREQEEVRLGGITGHLDCIIDGVVVDVKSASTPSFGKFKDGLTAATDGFGYLPQLDVYMQATGIHSGAFLAIDKTLGNIVLDRHPYSGRDYSAVVELKQRMLAGPKPERGFTAEADGASGNEKLGVACSYCPLKNSCWPELRTFIYANGPRYLTTVRRLPNVPEAT